MIATSWSTAYSDSGLQPGTTYSYAVAAIDYQDNLSPLTATVSVKTPYQGPQTRNVSNAQTLIAVLTEAEDNPYATYTINLAAGVYTVGSAGFPVISRPGTVIRGPEGSASAVIDGAGYTAGAIFTVDELDVTIENLEFIHVAKQAIHVLPGSDGGMISGCLIESAGSSAAIEIDNSARWLVIGNAVTGVTGVSSTAQPAIYVHGLKFDADILFNLILDCDRGIYIEGVGASLSAWQAWVENNMIADNRVNGFGGAAITLKALSQAYVMHNTTYTKGGYTNAIEYIDLPAAVYIWNNLTNRAITAIGGVTANLATNHTGAQQAWFKDIAECDLRLTGAISGVVDAGTRFSAIIYDIEGDDRPLGLAQDIGADEYKAPAVTPPTTPQQPSSPPASGGGGGGGGAPSYWFMGALMGLVLKRWRDRRLR